MSNFSPRKKNSSADNLLNLYTKIPDYAEVRHLGQSEFIRALEQLKEEFRQCRSSLYETESAGTGSSDETLIKPLKSLNIRDASADRLSFSTRSPGMPTTRFHSSERGDGPSLEIKGHQSQLHMNPLLSGSHYGLNNFSNYDKPSKSLSFSFEKGLSKSDFNLGERTQSATDRDTSRFAVESSDSESSESSSNWSKVSDVDSLHWRKSDAEYAPPRNIEQRLLERKTLNLSAPSLASQKAEDNDSKPVFKAHPVPSHVYKPLYDFIMLKNQRRSQRVREQSKQRLMAQVKPFSFSRDSRQSHFPQGSKSQPAAVSTTSAANTGREVLNNTRQVKGNKKCASHHHNNLRPSQFKANPAPPRTRALLSAMKLKEQQEYRELKKKLRSEALLKNAALPPSMAARDKRVKLCNAKLDSIIQEFQNSLKEKSSNRYQDREQSTDFDVEDNTFTDEDRLSEDSFRYLNSPPPYRKSGNISSKNSAKNFTPFGKSRHSSAASGVFECTSNDNLASRLRIQATRRREAERIKREEEELLKLMRNESRRKRLRDSHISAWRKAHSYSSNQDISMRRQLRMAASILERESFVRNMSSMLSRVRSAPLLLEGVRERRFEPCKKHREEFLQLADRSLLNNKQQTTPRFTPRKNRASNWFLDRYGIDNDDDASETAAVAEGSLSGSENESENSEPEQSNHESGDEDDNQHESGGRQSDTNFENAGSGLSNPRKAKKVVRHGIVDSA